MTTEMLQELLRRKAHIGTKDWNIFTSQFLLGFRNSPKMPSHAIINTEKTIIGLYQTILFLKSFQATFWKASANQLPISLVQDKKHTILQPENKHKAVSSFGDPFLHVLVITSGGQSIVHSNILHLLQKFGINESFKVSQEKKFQHISKTKNIHSMQPSFTSSQESKKKIVCSLLHERWVGGTLTNWKKVSQSISLYSRFKKRFHAFLEEHRIGFPIYQKSHKRFQYMDQMGSKLPDIIIFTHPEENEMAIKEAKILKLPIIAFVNTGLSPKILSQIDYMIPGNNQSSEFLHLCFQFVLLALTQRSFSQN